LVDLYAKQLEANGLEVTTEEVVSVEKNKNIFLVSTASGKKYEAIRWW